MRIPAALLLVLWLPACSVAERAPLALEPPADAIVWPRPPDVARYAYARTILGDEDFIVKVKEESKSTGRVVLELLTGLIFGPPKYLELLRPVSGTVDSKGRILVVDASRPGVVVFDMVKKKAELWDRGSDEESFVSPVAITEDGAGGFLVTDADLALVFRLGGDGVPKPPIGKGVLKRPTGVARDPETGNIYVSDTVAHRVVVFNGAGEVVDTLGGRGEALGEFNFPTHLSLRDRHLYVADTLNFRIQVFDLSGEGRLSIGQLGIRVGDFTRPKGVAVGADGRVYVIESYFDHLLVYSAKGTFLLPIGGSGSGPGQFYLPAGVWTDDKGRVFVADMFNGRVSVFKELTGGGNE